ncbi:hypothetical protein 1 [Shuangao sobemo-like virus 1]|uniref:hypothetical protein 1 n=1 Tax=Shuangao sobemo-like virus 1 TaxID=1923474 RepID=UPI00090A8BD5|nr:hypothetical protein 1 [Shuangao sobemo-like virus 1]APG75744.1 hypothetical protein 1 [Shuangao sobemo-like virus 1]
MLNALWNQRKLFVVGITLYLVLSGWSGLPLHTLVFRTVRYLVWKYVLRDTIAGQFLEELSSEILGKEMPPPPPPPPPKPIPPLTDRLYEDWIGLYGRTVNSTTRVLEKAYYSSWTSWFHMACNTIAIIVAIRTLFVAISRIIPGSPRTAVATWAKCKIRGIHYEAAIQGSLLRKATIPEWQVEVLTPGFLSDTHVGWGVRVVDTLVVPTHVLVEAGPNYLLKGRTGSVLCNGLPRDSRIMQDISYVPVEVSTWSKLGTPSVKRKRIDVETVQSVSCCGLEGASTGPLRQTRVRGLMYYEGTTMPGMSGAGYYIGNTCLGIHLGASTNVNCGATIMVPFAEIPAPNNLVVQVERSAKRPKKTRPPSGTSADPTYHAMDNTKTAWGYADIREALDDYDRFIGPSDWNNPTDDFDYDQDLGYEYEEEAATRGNTLMEQIRRMSVEDRKLWMDSINAVATEEAVAARSTPVANPLPSVRPMVQTRQGVPRQVTFDEIIVHNQTGVGTSTTIHTQPQPQRLAGPPHLGDLVRDLIKRVTILEQKMIQRDERMVEIENAVGTLQDAVAKYGSPEELEKLRNDLSGYRHTMQEIAADACIMTQDQVGYFRCEQCGKVLHSQYDLNEHRISVHKWKRVSKGRPTGSCSIASEIYGPKENPPKEEKPVSQPQRNRREVHEEELEKALPYKCTDCNRRFATESARLAHFGAVHAIHIAPESAIPTDSQDPVKTDRAFLGQRSRLRKQRRTKSADTSVSLAGQTLLQSLQAGQSEISHCLQSVSRSLNELQKVIHGRNSGTTQK